MVVLQREELLGLHCKVKLRQCKGECWLPFLNGGILQGTVSIMLLT